MVKKFFIRSKERKGRANLYIEVRKRTPQVRALVCTNVAVDIQTWERVNKTPKMWENYRQTEEGKALSDKLDLIEASINDAIINGIDNDGVHYDIEDGNNSLNSAILNTAVEKIINKELEDLKKKELEEQLEQKERAKKTIVGFYNYFLDGIKSGEILHHNGEHYEESTITIWNSFGKYLRSYTPADMTFDEITKPFADKFSTFLEKSGMMPKTINKNVICFRKLCNLSAEEGLNSNAVSLKVWKERMVKDNEKKAELYLTEEELDALYEMPLDGVDDKVRDLFMLGNFSCQRFSDYGFYTRENFKTTDNGTPVISLYQQKTGTYIEVPILDDRLFEICDKYHYHFPTVDKRTMNHHLKHILKRLSETVPTLAEKYVTQIDMRQKQSEENFVKWGKKVEKGTKLNDSERSQYGKLKKYAEEHNGSPLFERNSHGEVIMPKYDLISTHTARRSGITNLYKQGIFNTREMMAMSGHQSEKVFENYIKVGVSEQADRIAEKVRLAKKTRKKA
jgi:integrase